MRALLCLLIVWLAPAWPVPTGEEAFVELTFRGDDGVAHRILLTSGTVDESAASPESGSIVVEHARLPGVLSELVAGGRIESVGWGGQPWRSMVRSRFVTGDVELDVFVHDTIGFDLDADREVLAALRADLGGEEVALTAARRVVLSEGVGESQLAARLLHESLCLADALAVVSLEVEAIGGPGSERSEGDAVRRLGPELRVDRVLYGDVEPGERLEVRWLTHRLADRVLEAAIDGGGSVQLLLPLGLSDARASGSMRLASVSHSGPFWVGWVVDGELRVDVARERQIAEERHRNGRWAWPRLRAFSLEGMLDALDREIEASFPAVLVWSINGCALISGGDRVHPSLAELPRQWRLVDDRRTVDRMHSAVERGLGHGRPRDPFSDAGPVSTVLARDRVWRLRMPRTEQQWDLWRVQLGLEATNVLQTAGDP